MSCIVCNVSSRSIVPPHSIAHTHAHTHTHTLLRFPSLHDVPASTATHHEPPLPNYTHTTTGVYGISVASILQAYPFRFCVL